MSSTSELYFRTTENEQIETNIHICPDARCAILGHVTDSAGRPAAGALALLFDCEGESALIARSFTDADGDFFFGPLSPNRLHRVKLFKDGTKVRELEIRMDQGDQ